MILISSSVIISFAVNTLAVPPLQTQSSFNALVEPPIALPQVLCTVIESNPFEEEEVEIENAPCRNEPIGLGIPGFQPGIPKESVIRMFGAPSKMLPGYWPNTNALSYELVPDEVSVGFLFDKDSQLLRQTEASFAPTVKTEIILGTLNSMLGCRLNEEITQGFRRVWQGQTRRYSFSLGTLNGLIEWEDMRLPRTAQEPYRVYIGIWEAGLHK